MIRSTIKFITKINNSNNSLLFKNNIPKPSSKLFYSKFNIINNVLENNKKVIQPKFGALFKNHKINHYQNNGNNIGNINNDIIEFKKYEMLMEKESNRLFKPTPITYKDQLPQYLSSSIGSNSLFGICFLIAIIVGYIWSEKHFNNLSTLFNHLKDDNNILLEFNNKLNGEFQKVVNSNNLIIDQNNLQIKKQEIRSILSLIFTFFSLLLFLIDYKKKY